MEKTVEAYLDTVPEPARGTLEKIRKSIRAALPEGAEEIISYGIPAFRVKKLVVGYAAFAKHCSFFIMSTAVTRDFAAELEGYETSKGTIRFPVNKPLPAALIKKLVKARLAENEKGRRRSDLA